jgi:hypothetical protein
MNTGYHAGADPGKPGLQDSAGGVGSQTVDSMHGFMLAVWHPKHDFSPGGLPSKPPTRLLMPRSVSFDRMNRINRIGFILLILFILSNEVLTPTHEEIHAG